MQYNTIPTRLEDISTRKQNDMDSPHHLFAPMCPNPGPSPRLHHPHFITMLKDVCHPTLPATNRLAPICRTRPHLAGNIAVTGCFPPYHEPRVGIRSVEAIPRSSGRPLPITPRAATWHCWHIRTSQSQCRPSSLCHFLNPSLLIWPCRFRWFLSGEEGKLYSARIPRCVSQILAQKPSRSTPGKRHQGARPVWRTRWRWPSSREAKTPPSRRILLCFCGMPPRPST
ncbi:hypothetical protein LX36DRAFT_209434 [Colletotrichum falcatum]|nr:hypothetical protein LX36DRAFT_209434 [Colletotrichum falcatum]